MLPYPERSTTMIRTVTAVTSIALLFGAGPAADAEAQSGLEKTAGSKPNVVVIFCDDLGYGDLGVFGHPTIRTPNLDRMASEGQKWTQFYAAASVCTPSRAGLLTGRYPIRSGLAGRPRVLFEWSAGGIPESEITLAEQLKKAGYATAAVGKWHLGHTDGHLPTQNGFDSYFGIPYSNDMRVDTEMPVADDCRFRMGMTLEKMRDPDQKKGGWVPLVEGTKVVEYPADQNTLVPRYTERAVKFITEHRQGPFFLYFPHTFPHVPLYASDEFRGTSERGLYGDVIEELDWSVGRVLETLRELDIADETLVVFTSDNGPWLVKNLRGGSAGLLRNGKGTTWEGGMREPTLAWWPGHIEPGSVVTGLGSTLDLFATASYLAGVNLPEDRAMDSYNLTPALLGEGASPRDDLFFYRGDELYAARVGDFKAHYITQGVYGRGPGKRQHDPPQLYQLGHDPSEQFDVAKEHADVLEKIHARVEQHRATIRDVPDQLSKRQNGN